jgi:hypothetical protein
MEQYKQNWTGNGEWKYQCAELEESYAEFVKSKEAVDLEYIADHEEYLKELNEYNEKKEKEGETLEMVTIN